MRDFVAGIIAFALLVAAASLATTLQYMRKRRQRTRDVELQRGRTVIAELPAGDDLILFSEDDVWFHYGEQSIQKQHIAAVRVLINGSPIAAVTSKRLAREVTQHPTSFEDRPEGIARDRWDVAIEGIHGTLLVECGAIRERVSQELARTVFDAVRRTIDADNGP
jgi:hypothetical protein